MCLDICLYLHILTFLNEYKCNNSCYAHAYTVVCMYYFVSLEEIKANIDRDAAAFHLSCSINQHLYKIVANYTQDDTTYKQNVNKQIASWD